MAVPAPKVGFVSLGYYPDIVAHIHVSWADAYKVRELVVVGAGIVGASVAYHAARAGATVTLVDAGRPGLLVPVAPVGRAGDRRTRWRQPRSGVPRAVCPGESARGDRVRRR